jgi:SWI/SNF chromatin-remodeling complex subunit SWI1
MPNSALNPSLLEPSMSQNPNARTTQLRQQQFLNGLHNLMAKRNTPLPPFLTGVPVPNYDQARSPWAAIEPGSEIGSFKLADKDVNLFKLWGLVFAHGGGQVVRLYASEPLKRFAYLLKAQQQQ